MVDPVRLRDREEGEEGDHHFAALLQGREEGGDRIDRIGFRKPAHMADPRRHPVAELHHHAGRAEAAHRPRDGVEREEALHELREEVREQDREDAEERPEVEDDECLRRERRPGVREEAHLEGRARERRAVRLHEAMYAAVRVHDLGEQRLDGHQMQVHLLDDGHDGDAGDGRAEERPPVRRARERTLPPDQRDDRHKERNRRQFKRRIAVLVEHMVQSRRLHHRPDRHQQQ